MIWREQVEGKWASDTGYALRQREGWWQLYDADGFLVGVPRSTLEKAQEWAEEHAAQASGG